MNLGWEKYVNSELFLLIERRAQQGVAEVRLHTPGDSVRVTTGKETGLGRVVIRLTPPYHHSQGLGCSTRFKCSLLPEHLPKGSLQQVLRELKDSLLPPCVLGCRVLIVPLKEQVSSLS